MSKSNNNSQNSSNGHIALSKSIAKTNEQPLAKGESVGSNPTSDANIILDLCGGTGSWSKPFEKAGFLVYNITLPKYNVKNFSIRGNKIIFYGNELIELNIKQIYGILSAPPCTEFSFARTNAKRKRNLKEAMNIVKKCLEIIWGCNYYLKYDAQKKPHLKFWALENPNGMLKWFLGKPAFEFSPYEFGDNYKKKTQIWGDFNIPEKKNPKKKDKFDNLRQVVGAEGLNSLVKFDRMLSKDIHPEYYGKLTRQERRAITPKGFAEAFCKAQLSSKHSKENKLKESKQ